MNFKNKLKKYEVEFNLEVFIIMININNCFWIVCVLFVILLVWVFFYFSVYWWYVSGEFFVVIVGFVVMMICFYLGRWVLYIFNKVFFNVKYFFGYIKKFI